MSQLKRTRFGVSSSALMAVSSFSGAFFPFLRGVVLARLLSPEEFGIAITASIVSGVADLVTDIGISQLAVKADSAENIDTLHALALIRGIILFAAVALSAPLLAILFHSEKATSIYVVLAVTLLIKNFSHLEMKLNTRTYNYLPEATALVCAQIIWTVVTVAYAAVFKDFWAMTYGLLAYATSYVVITHLFATKPWRLRWDRALVKQTMAFGRPLALNGITYAIVSLGDRMLIGARLSMGELARYTALSTSAFLPRSVLSSYLNALFLPHFVNSAGKSELGKVADLWFIVIAIFAGVFGFGYLAAGKFLTSSVFGHIYEPEQSLVSLMALLGTIRYVGCLPTPPALAFSRTSLLLRYTLLSTSGLGLGALLLFRHPSLELLIIGISVGETVSLVWLVLQLRKFLSLTKTVVTGTVAMPLLATAACALLLQMLEPMHPVKQAAICAGGLALYLVGCLFMLKSANLTLRDVFGAVLPKRKAKHAAAAQLAQA